MTDENGRWRRQTERCFLRDWSGDATTTADHRRWRAAAMKAERLSGTRIGRTK
jgi:hypothetical protein